MSEFGLSLKSISSCQHVYLRGLDFVAGRPTKNSDRERKSDFKSGTSCDKII